MTPDEALAQEVLETLISADSLLSLVAYRYPTGLPYDVVADMKDTAHRARQLYESMPRRIDGSSDG